MFLLPNKVIFRLTSVSWCASAIDNPHLKPNICFERLLAFSGPVLREAKGANDKNRDGSRIFFRRGAPLRNGVTDWWTPINHIFLGRIPVVLESLRGGGAHPLHPPPRSAPEENLPCESFCFVFLFHLDLCPSIIRF